MHEIELERFGKVLEGEFSEGYFVQVHHDPDETGGYYIFVVDDIESPTDGGDYWMLDMTEVRRFFEAAQWRIDWSIPPTTG